jgi:hypothetical protein
MKGRKEYYDKKQKNKQMLIDAMNKTHKVGQKNNTHVTLIKDHDDYHLVNDEQFIIGTTDESILSCTDKYKLSIKNCQAIEHGYDLDELIDKYCRGNSKIEDDFIKKGFQKALEILGDKKFSMTDMKRARDKGERDGEILWDEFIKSLQQNEWLVEIVKETYHDCKFVDDGNTYSFEPKWREALDEKNCIILKKI